MRRVFVGAGYVAALAAGAVTSFQLWAHALDVRDGVSVHGLSLPRAHERVVPALVLPLLPASPSVRSAPSRIAVANPFSAVGVGPAPFEAGPVASPGPSGGTTAP